MRKQILITLALAVGLTTLAGCSLQSRIGGAANTIVSNYCTKPAVERAVLRTWMDIATAPNQVRVNCATDVVNPPTTEATTQ